MITEIAVKSGFLNN